MSITRGLLVGTVAVLLGWAGSGCSSYRSDARAASRAEASATGSSGGIEGLWVGRWESDKDPSHGGRMEMVVTRTGDTLYRGASRAWWWRVFRSSYDTRLVVTPVKPGEYLIHGGRNLWAFGDHTLTGRVDAARLEGSYRVGRHGGKVVLTRAGSGSEGPQ